MGADRVGRAGAVFRCAALASVLVAVSASVPLPPPAVAAETVTFVARIDGRPVSQASESRPVALHPTRPLLIDLQVTNSGPQPVQIRTVRLAGSVVGLPFFGYQTTVGINLGPGTTVTRQYSLDIVGLAGQATGLIPSSLSLLDQDHKEIASDNLIVDVRGSMRSVYGLFGLVIALLTALSFGGAALALARNRLPDNRWQRGMRFLVPGIGLGLSLVFAFSTLRIFVPRAGRWAPMLLISAGALFALGYFSPTPDDREPELEDVASAT